MTDHNSIEFAGRDPRDDTTLPGWFRSATGAEADADAEFPSLNEVARQLPRAEKADLFYANTETDEHDTVPNHVALVNPEWLDPAAGENPVWHVPTDDYTIVNPMDLLGPLGAVLRRRSEEVGDVYGSVRQYRRGGEIHGDVLFDGVRAGEPGTPHDPYVFGFSFGTDHMGSQATYADVLAYDERSGTAYRSLMRGVVNKHKRRHVGKATENIADWWDDLIDTVLRAADALIDIIIEADSYVIDFTELPFDAEEFYTTLGFADDHAEFAAAALPNDPSAWELYQAIAFALDERFDGKTSGGAMKRHVSRANNILYSPPKAEDLVLAEHERRLEEQATLGEGDEKAAAVITDRRESISDKVSAFKTTKERLAALVEAAEEADAEDEADAADSDEEDADSEEVAA